MAKASLWNRIVDKTRNLFHADQGLLGDDEQAARKHIVILGPEKHPSYSLFCSALSELNFIVTGIGSKAPKEVSRDLSEALDRYLYVPDLTKIDTLQRALGLLTFEFGKINALHSFIDDWDFLELELRQDFHIPGLNAEQRIREQSRQSIRDMLETNDIPYPKGRAIPDFKALQAFCSVADYPVMVKPEFGSGLRGICRIETQSDLRDIGPHLNYPSTAERQIAGKLFNLEGLVDHNGTIIFEQWIEVDQCPLESKVSKGPHHFYSLREIPENISKLGAKIVKLFGIQSRFFQIEFVQNSHNAYTVIDLNWRLPGGFSADLMNFSCDIDIFRLWAQVLNESAPTDFSYERKYFCAHIGRRDSRSYQFTDRELQKKLKGGQCLYVKELPPPFSEIYGDRIIMVRADNIADISEAIRIVEKGPS